MLGPQTASTAQSVYSAAAHLQLLATNPDAAAGRPSAARAAAAGVHVSRTAPHDRARMSNANHAATIRPVSSGGWAASMSG